MTGATALRYCGAAATLSNKRMHLAKERAPL